MLAGRNFSVRGKWTLTMDLLNLVENFPHDSSLPKVIRFFSAKWVRFLARESESVLGSVLKSEFFIERSDSLLREVLLT